MGAFPSSVQIGKYSGSSQKHELHVKCVKVCQLNAKIRPSALWSTANVSAQKIRLEVGFVV